MATASVTVRLTEEQVVEVDDLVEESTQYTNRSEFIRAAIAEKLRGGCS